jgi:S-adenosylmethionine synthetase
LRNQTHASAFATAIRSLSVHIDPFGTGTISDDKILAAVLKVFSFKPADILKQLNVLRLIYSKATNYGPFGKIDDKEIAWELTNKAYALKKAAKQFAVIFKTISKAARGDLCSFLRLSHA